MGLEVEIVGIDEAIKKFDSLDEIMLTQTIKQVVKSALIIETKAKKAAPSDTGRLRSSIQTEFKNHGLSATIFSDVEYAAHVEYGTKAHFPPSSALIGWARRHNMGGMEFLIARSINKNGTKAQPFLVPAFESEKENFIDEIEKITMGLGD